MKYKFKSNVKIVNFTGDNPSSFFALSDKNIVISLGTSDTLLFNAENYSKQNFGHILISPKSNTNYMGMLCYKNGSLTREKILDNYINSLGLEGNKWEMLRSNLK